MLAPVITRNTGRRIPARRSTRSSTAWDRPKCCAWSTSAQAPGFPAGCSSSAALASSRSSRTLRCARRPRRRDSTFATRAPMRSVFPTRAPTSSSAFKRSTGSRIPNRSASCCASCALAGGSRSFSTSATTTIPSRTRTARWSTTWRTGWRSPAIATEANSCGACSSTAAFRISGYNRLPIVSGSITTG